MNEKEITKWAIIGPGGMANEFTDYLRKVDGSEIVAVAGIDLESAETFARKHLVPKAYGSFCCRAMP